MSVLYFIFIFSQASSRILSQTPEVDRDLDKNKNCTTHAHVHAYITQKDNMFLEKFFASLRATNFGSLNLQESVALCLGVSSIQPAFVID
jgi:hypothetical protein